MMLVVMLGIVGAVVAVLVARSVEIHRTASVMG